MEKHRCRYAMLVVFFACAMAIQLGNGAFAAEKPITFSVYISPDRMPLFDQFAAAFKEKTGLTIELLTTPTGQAAKWDQVLVQVAGGVAPDLVGATSVEFVQYAAKGVIQPLDAYLKPNASLMQNIVPFISSALCWQGKQYLMAYGASAVALYYNPNMFNAAGLALPPRNSSDTSWNWTKFVTTMQKLTKKTSDGTVTQYGLAGPYWDSWITLPYTWGGDWIDPTLKEFWGMKPETLASVQALQDLGWNYGVMGSGIGLLWDAKAAVAGIGTWALKQTMDNPNNLVFAPWFRVEPHPVRGAVNSMGVAMLAGSTNKENAWKLLEFATLDPVGNLLFAQAFGAVPAHKLAQVPWMKSISQQRPDFNVQGLIESIAANGSIISIRKVTTFNEIDKIMRTATTSVLNNVKSARQAIEEVAGTVQQLINDGAQ